MFQEFLRDFNCVLNEERQDFEDVKRVLSATPAFRVFQPMVMLDGKTMALLENYYNEYLQADRKEWVFIIPVGVHDFHMKPSLAQMLRDFYRDDVIPKMNTEEVEFEQSVLLNLSGLSYCITDRAIGSVNTVYLEMTVAGRRTVHAFIMFDTPERVWRLMTECYGIGADVFVDSNKGFGEPMPSSEFIREMPEYTPSELSPAFFLLQYYRELDADSGFILLKANDEYSLYFTPWGKDSPYGEEVERQLRYAREQKEHYEECHRVIEEYLISPSGKTPLEEVTFTVKY